jgi:hypothetical protein
MDVLSLIPSVLAYDPETGLLIWKVNRGPAKVGDIAGCEFTDNAGKKYRVLKLRQKMQYAHRIAYVLMTGNWPKGQVDHIDGNGLNNKWDNLRDVTHSENSKNTRKQTRNKSGCTGVIWDKVNSKWFVYIRVNGVMRNLGRYSCKDEAVRVRKQSEVKHGYHPNHGSDRPL